MAFKSLPRVRSCCGARDRRAALLAALVLAAAGALDTAVKHQPLCPDLFLRRDAPYTGDVFTALEVCAWLCIVGGIFLFLSAIFFLFGLWVELSVFDSVLVVAVFLTIALRLLFLVVALIRLKVREKQCMSGRDPLAVYAGYLLGTVAWALCHAYLALVLNTYSLAHAPPDPPPAPPAPPGEEAPGPRPPGRVPSLRQSLMSVISLTKVRAPAKT